VPDERASNASETPTGVGSITSGTWAASAHVCKMAPYLISEFRLILKGTVIIKTEDMTTLVFNAGDAFFIELGTVLSWRQPGVVRKYYVIHSESDPPQEPITSRL